MRLSWLYETASMSEKESGPTDASLLADQTSHAVSKIRDMTDDLRAVLEHEERVAGDLMRCSEGKAAER
jgi:hypothetical protein